MNDRKIVVFDLDHTLCYGNLSFSFGKYLYKQHILSLADALYCSACYAAYRYGFLSISHLYQLIGGLVFREKKIESMRSLVRDFVVEEIPTLVNPWVINELLSYPSEYIPVLLSASPSILVEEVARHFQFQHWEATTFHQDNEERFLGVESVLDGEGKLRFVKKLSSLYSVSLDCVIAYSDSFFDLPLLSAIGEPIIVNPDRKLHREARKQNWKIV